MSNDTKITTAGQQLTLERTFNAPRKLVFRAWSEPELLAHWWGPKGWTLPVCNIDFRPGGVWHFCMRGPAGEESWGKAIYHEIVAPERIVYTDYFSDAGGNISEKMPAASITVLFTEQDGKTKVTSNTQYPTAADLESVIKMGMIEGITETLDRLEQYLANA